MIRIEPTTAEWVHANFAADKAIDDSLGVWRVVDDGVVVLVAGIIRPNFLGWCELWVVVGELCARRWSTLRARAGLVELVRLHFPVTVAHTRGSANERFARFFGLRPVGSEEVGGERWMRFEL